MSQDTLHSVVKVEALPVAQVRTPVVYEQEPGALSPSALLQGLYHQRYLFTLVGLVVIALGFIYIFASHKKYTSTMELLVQNARSVPVVTAGRVEASASAAEVTDEELNSESELLQSADVLDEVAEPGWKVVSPNQRSPKQLSQHESRVADIRKGLVIAPVRKSHILSIQLTTRDPYRSTQLLNDLVRVFLAKKAEISHSSGTAEIFAQQADQYRQQWENAQHQLAQYQQDNAIVSIGDQEAGLQKQLFDAQGLLRDTTVEAEEARRKLNDSRKQLAVLPQRRESHETTLPASASLDQLRSRLSELTISRAELLGKYKPTDRLLEQVEIQIKQVNEAIEEAKEVSYSQHSTDINPTWQLVEQDVSQTQTKLQGLTGRIHELTAQINSIESRLGATEGKSQTLTSLQHKVTELDGNYQLYIQKRDEARMTDVLDAHQLLNVSVVQTPTFTLSPSKPLPLRDAMLTILTACFLAGFSAFVAEATSSTIRNQGELEQATGHPVLAVLNSSHQLSGRKTNYALTASERNDF